MRFFSMACLKIAAYSATCLMLLSAPVTQAEGEILTIEGARIRGNQELPNVLYVVPWQPPQVYKLDAPDQSLASTRKLKTLERESFKRLLSYHQAFQQRDETLEMP